jgi:hypothetical protein
MFQGTCCFHLSGGSEHSWNVEELYGNCEGIMARRKVYESPGWGRDRAMPEPMERTAQIYSLYPEDRDSSFF